MKATIRYSVNAVERTADLADVLTIGRARDNDLPLLDDTAVSRHHARISRETAAYLLEDLGSQNGTFIERADAATRVGQATELRSGDVIKIGQARIIFETVVDESEPPSFDPDVTQVPHTTIRGDYRPSFRKEQPQPGADEKKPGRGLSPFKRRPKSSG